MGVVKWWLAYKNGTCWVHVVVFMASQVMTLASDVVGYKQSGGPCYIHLHNPKDYNLNLNRHCNPKSCKLLGVFSFALCN